MSSEFPVQGHLPMFSTADEVLKNLLASFLFCPTGCGKHHLAIKSEVQKQEHLPKSSLEKAQKQRL
jgi:hypothetical protein